jgi:glycogen operon protein
VIYECHVKGATKLHPGIPPELQGTYAGLAQSAFIDHVTSMGITAVELMPVHQFVSEQELLRAGTSDYWGYNSIGFFAPHNAYSSSGDAGQQVAEFKTMVDTFHANGLEIILDVVFNHTAEGGQYGPSFSFRGLGEGSYYLLKPGGSIENDTGTGNEINPWDPAVLQMILDSLRYWVTDMHVDGFRFDLATVLSQTDSSHSVSVFLYVVGQDPVLASVKLIAEPWDTARWEVGRFPHGWSEWNDQFRIGVRSAWRSDAGVLPAFREIFEGSPSLFRPTAGNNPTGSVNYAAAHDGYTLRDLVSYTDTGQGAWDSGGPADSTDPRVLMFRANRQRAMLATVALSQGVPMICHGDELGRTQLGNNNAYNQDNRLAWIDWASADQDLLSFTRRVFEIRAANPVFRLRRWTTGATPTHADQPLEWFDPSGTAMSDTAWNAGTSVTVTAYLDGQAIPFPDGTGQPVVGDSFLLMFNAWWEPLPMVIPPSLRGPWRVVLDGSQPTGAPTATDAVASGTALEVAPRSLLVLRRGP